MEPAIFRLYSEGIVKSIDRFNDIKLSAVQSGHDAVHRISRIQDFHFQSLLRVVFF